MQEESSFNDELWAQIRKDFGDHLMRQQEFIKARKNFEESLQLQPDKLDSVYRLARSLTREAKVTEALKILKSRSTQDNYENHFKCNLQECDCHYEQHDFEQNILCLNEKMAKYKNVQIDSPYSGPLALQKIENAKFQGPKLSKLNQRFQRTITNFDDTLGVNAGECLWNQRKYIEKAVTRWKPNNENADITPRIVKFTDPCKLLTKPQKDKRLSIVQKYRFDKIRMKFAQSYMGSSWKAYIGLTSLKTNPILQGSTQNENSFKNINQALNTCIISTSALIEQLHARCPLYAKDHQMYRSEKQRMEICEVRSYRTRKRLCREIYTAMAEMNRWRVEGKLENLIMVAENELGLRFRVNSNKLIPRKNEFIVQICNFVAMAHIDELVNPQIFRAENLSKQRQRASSIDIDDYAILGRLFGLKTKSRNVLTSYVFGDQSTYRDPMDSKLDKAFDMFKEKFVHLEDRKSQKPMLSIEKCHIYYEMGRLSLKQSLNEETKLYGGLVVQEAGNVHHLWSFLGSILTVRADIMQKNFPKLVESLAEASRRLDNLRDLEKLPIDRLHSILLQATELNNHLMKIKE